MTLQTLRLNENYMTNDYIKYSLLFVICVLTQALIFNYVILFKVAIPIVFIYFIIRLPIQTKLSWVFTLSFLLGLFVDIFSDTPGVNALSCTLIAALRRPIYFAYMAKDDITVRLVPSVSAMGVVAFAKYLITFVIIYCFLAFTIEYFSFANVKSIVVLTISSTLLTSIILFSADCLIPSKS